ncbi:hypothetical protein [Stutzerimonas nitrititolerans]|uniref:hypothetical protein n=1 Tax=Stutzerimonas nitrititolerans TaxID=2482751 RepID=UPI0028AFD790|nr:hypothetical protein [Stutzerimonas nitrititolerans]
MLMSPYIEEAKRVKSYVIDSIEYVEASRKRRLIFAVCGGILFGLTTWATLWNWARLDRLTMLEQSRALGMQEQEASSSIAIEMLELCAQAKNEKSKLAKYFCDEAETYTYRAIGDVSIQARVKEYFSKGAYLMAVIVVKNNLHYAKLDAEAKRNTEYEGQYLTRLRWTPIAVCSATFLPIIPYGVMYMRARRRRKSSWKDAL